MALTQDERDRVTVDAMADQAWAECGENYLNIQRIARSDGPITDDNDILLIRRMLFHLLAQWHLRNEEMNQQPQERSDDEHPT